jgi:hypothetical protein
MLALQSVSLAIETVLANSVEMMKCTRKKGNNEAVILREFRRKMSLCKKRFLRNRIFFTYLLT